MNALRQTHDFLDMLAALLEGGLTVPDSLCVLSGEGFPAPLRSAARETLSAMGRGDDLSAALDGVSARKGSRIRLSRAQVALVRAASLAGTPVGTLRGIAEDLSGRMSAERSFMDALAYPCLVVAFALAMTFVLVARIFPLYASLGVDVVSGASAVRGIVSALSFLMLAVASAYFALVRAFRAESAGRAVFGVLSLLTESGVPLAESLARCRDCVADGKTRLAIGFAERRVRAGMSLSRAFAESGLFGPFAVSWLAVADKGGNPASAFRPIEAYFAERDRRVRAFAARMVEPTLIGIVGAYLLILVETVIVPALAISGGIHV